MLFSYGRERLAGALSFVKKNFSLVILAIIIISVMPAVIEYWRARKEARANCVGEGAES